MNNSKSALVIADVKNINIGDRVIFDSIKEWLLDSGFNHVYKLSNESITDKEKTLVCYYNPMSVITAFKKCSQVYLGGGGIFQDDTSRLNLFYFGFFTWVSTIFKKPLIIKAVGVTPISSSLGQGIIRYISRKASSISVRDQASRENLLALGSFKIDVEPDLALTYTPKKIKGEKLRELNQISSHPFFIVSIRPLLKKSPISKNEFLISLANQLTKIVEKYKIKPLFLPFNHEQDEEFIQLFLTHYYQKEYIFLKQISANEYLFLSEKSSFAICMRLHAAILASRYSIPIIALSYNDKVKHFMVSTNRGQYCLPLNKTNTLLDTLSSIPIHIKNS